MRINIFGDSITWGAFLPFRGSWGNLLRNYLESFDDQIALYDLGIDADTSEDVLSRFKSEAGVRTPDLIIFAVGTNDSAYIEPGHNNLVALDDFVGNVKKLIKQGRAFTDKILFVGLAKGDDSRTTPLPRSVTGKNYSKEEVKKYNDALRKACVAEKVKFVDIYDDLKDEDFDDGLHPNLGGHQKIFEAVRRSLKAYVDQG